jgi:hypothetical protein
MGGGVGKSLALIPASPDDRAVYNDDCPYRNVSGRQSTTCLVQRFVHEVGMWSYAIGHTM